MRVAWISRRVLIPTPYALLITLAGPCTVKRLINEDEGWLVHLLGVVLQELFGDVGRLSISGTVR